MRINVHGIDGKQGDDSFNLLQSLEGHGEQVLDPREIANIRHQKKLQRYTEVWLARTKELLDKRVR